MKAAALGVLFPPVCRLCGIEIDELKTDLFCQDCQSALCPLDVNQCQRCSAMVGPHLKSDSGCYYCRETNFAFQTATSLASYEGHLKYAILSGKVAFDTVVLKSLTRLLYENYRERIDQHSPDLIVPIPHYWLDRLRYRNQASTTIAYELSNLTGIPIAKNVLRKVKRTVKQHDLTPAQRRKNLQGAFAVSPQANIAEMSVLLVDDVMTTGTTCQRAAKELQKAGSKEVNVVALGRGIGA